MSNASDARKELERWKDKYFEQNENFEEQKKCAQDYAALLQRILVRVSLAAENVSERLDDELNGLRSAIRTASAEDNDLEERLKRIDKLILASDETKQQNTSQIVKILDQLIEQLLAIKLPRKQKNALKKLSKSLSKEALNLEAYPGILSEYAGLQANVLQEIVQPQEKEQGFFSRILGGNRQEPVTDDSGNIQEQSEADLELETDEETIEAEEIAPGFSSVARHIRDILTNLLDQLSVP